jgi:hypothetical protein
LPIDLLQSPTSRVINLIARALFLIREFVQLTAHGLPYFTTSELHLSTGGTAMARKSPLVSQSPAAQKQPKPRPIGKTASGKPTPLSGGKDKVDEASEESFPASDPPAAASSPDAAQPDNDISPARFVDPQEFKKQKPR